MTTTPARCRASAAVHTPVLPCGKPADIDPEPEAWAPVILWLKRIGGDIQLLPDGVLRTPIYDNDAVVLQPRPFCLVLGTRRCTERFHRLERTRRWLG